MIEYCVSEYRRLGNFLLKIIHDLNFLCSIFVAPLTDENILMAKIS